MAEAGKHEELLKKGGSYSRLFKEQKELERFSETHKESSTEKQKDTGFAEHGIMEDLQDKTGEREDTVEKGGEKYA